MITKSIKLYLGDGFPVRIPVSQYDTMWQFVFTIVNNSRPWQIPTGATAVLNGKKPDGNVFAFAGTIENNTVTVDADVQMTAVAGQTVCELSILANNKTVGTANFILDVEEAPKSADDVVSDTVLDGYGMMVTNAVDDWMNSHGGQIGGLTNEVKQALLTLLENVAYANDQSQTYLDALEDALYPPAELVSISALYTQSGTVYDTDTLDSLKADLVVTAYYDDSSSETITTYTLSGTLTEGTSTVTVAYEGKTATFNVFVTKGELDTTAQIATEGYITHDAISTHDTVAIANGGITIAYEMDAPSAVLAPAGVIVQSGILSNSTGTIRAYNGEALVTHVDEVNRWGKAPASSYTEHSQSWPANEYDHITFSLDTRYLDDSYMYDGITGQVWFAGRNTPFYGMTNVSEAYGELPDGYTKLSYVKSTGEQHINTGYTPTSSTKFYIDAQTRTAGTSAPGGQDEGNTQRTMFEAINGTNWAGNNILLAPYRTDKSATGYWGWYNTSTTKQIYSGDVDDDRHRLTLVRDAYKTGGTLNWSGTPTTPSITYTYPVSLFGFLRNGTYSHMNDDMTLYAFRMYEGKDSSIPTANLVPCKDPNNVVGLYDTIRREFYHSTTGTELIGGEVV